MSFRRSYQPRRYSILNSEPRQRLKSSSSIDAHQIFKANKSATVVAKIPAILVAKELSDIVIYTQAIKFRGLFIVRRRNVVVCTRVNCLGLTCATTTTTTTNVMAGKAIRKIPKRNIQQLVAQPSTTSTSTN